MTKTTHTESDAIGPIEVDENFKIGWEKLPASVVRALGIVKRATVAMTPTLPRDKFLCKSLCGGSHMATNLSIDPDLIDRALKVSGERTKKAAVTLALEEFVARRRQKKILDLMGKLEWDKSFDYKKERSRS